MYLTHFGLERRPFSSTPDAGCYYPATGHEQVLARLVRALQDGEAMLLLTGEAGTGKTLLCHCLLERFHDRAVMAFLTNSHIGSRKDLLQAILYDLTLPYEPGTEQELRLRLTDFLLRNFAAGKKAILLVDEAHYLSADALEELRLLCNLEAGDGKAVQVVLVAQPNIKRLLSRHELASIRQRLGVRAHLNALGVDESVDYLLHHLRAAGGQAAAIASDEAFEVLARGTRGVPRLLNQAGHQALSLAYELDVETVDAEVALEVLSSMGLECAEANDDVAGAASPTHSVIEVKGNLAAVGSAQPGTPPMKVAPAPDSGNGSIREAEHDVLAYRLYEPPRQPA